jgi:hypothetical protein
MVVSTCQSSAGSDELLGGEELREPRATVAVVGDDLALLTRGALREGDDRGPRGVEAFARARVSTSSASLVSRLMIILLVSRAARRR